MTIIDSQVDAYEANTPKRPWHSVPNWPYHVTGDDNRTGRLRYRSQNLRNSLLIFPVSREFVDGDGFECDCIRHNAAQL